MSKKALGKGIGALLGDLENGGQDAGTVIRLPLDSLKPGSLQPRREFTEESLEELARSIREKGILQPVLVEKGEDGYVIVAGERRYRAAKLAGLESVPVMVRRFAAHEKLEIALIENIQREDLTPVEEARAYNRMMEISNLRQEEVASRVGKSRSTVANSLRLLKLPPEMLDALEGGRISAGHARAILSVVNPADASLLFRKILRSDLSVRQAETEAQLLNRGRRGSTGKEKRTLKPPEPELLRIQDNLIDALGTKVMLRGDLRKGQIRISYFSQDDLERLLEVLGVS